MFNSNMNNRHAKNSREIKIVQIAWVASRVLYTECPKINRKSVLHLLKYRFAVYVLQMQYRVAVNFGTLSRYIYININTPLYITLGYLGPRFSFSRPQMREGLFSFSPGLNHFYQQPDNDFGVIAVVVVVYHVSIL